MIAKILNLIKRVIDQKASPLDYALFVAALLFLSALVGFVATSFSIHRGF